MNGLFKIGANYHISAIAPYITKWWLGSVAKVDNANKTADLLTAPLNEVPKTTPLFLYT